MSARAAATCVAVDLGASSGRVVVGECTPDRVTLHEVHRFPNTPRSRDGRVRWDVRTLFAETLAGLRRTQTQHGPLDSVGIDSWAVDYGLLDAAGALQADPISYRDAQTGPAVEQVLGELGAAELYASTGIQLQPFNTLFQLLARQQSRATRAASRALLIPDLLCHWLGAAPGTELTNASTTQLLDPRTMDWSYELAARFGVPLHLFGPLRAPGDLLGPVGAQHALAGNPQIITVPSHDTAAAVAGIPADREDFGYVCTGTWALVGVELTEPVITHESYLANFTNEVGVDGTVRFLKNVTGFWLLQECVRDWQHRGQAVDLAALTAAAAELPAFGSVIDVTDSGWLAAGDMPARITRAARGARPDSPAALTRCILDSMALAIRDALRDAASLSGREIRVVHVVGGGVGNVLFCQLVADACQLPVVAGPTEAAAWGNVMAQARALEVVTGSRWDMRALVARSERTISYVPRESEAALQRARQRLREADPTDVPVELPVDRQLELPVDAPVAP